MNRHPRYRKLHLPIALVSLSLILAGSLFFRDATAQTSAVFVRTDTTTQGNWIGAYGSDGYHVINNAISYPSYAQVTASGQSSWTWAASTSNIRALRKAGGSGRIAASWFSATSFTIDINLTDGLAHQVAIYCLDWDTTARAQTVEVLNAANNAVLDTRAVTAFNGGKYLVWNLSGNVRLRVTRTAGDNAAVSGIFFAPTGNTPPTVNITSPANGASFTAPANITINATASDSNGSVTKVEFFQGATKLGEDATSPYSFAWNGVAAGSYSLTARATDNGGATATSSAVNITVTSGGAPTASFVGADTGTRGNWRGVYGADGYNVINDAVSYPAYATVTPSGNGAWTWAATTSDTRALQKAVGSDRIAATWFSGGSFTINVNLTGGTPRQFALYSLDWDGGGARGQTVEILNASNGAALDTRSLTAFNNGVYLIWNLSGNVNVRVTRTAGDNAVVSGLFFAPVSTNTPPAAALTSPANGASYTAPANVAINATASDSDGTINRVEFYSGSTLIGTDTTNPYSMTWSNIGAGSYSLTARAFDNGGANTASAPVSITVNSASDPRATVGEWSAAQDWPCIPIHLHLLPNGKVLLWQSNIAQTGDPGDSSAYVWDPTPNTFTLFQNNRTNLFCSGHSFLPDGRLLVTGGHIANDVGERHINLFDFNTNTWTAGPDMNAGRWYPSNCALANGEAVIISGTIDTSTFNNLPQVYQTNGTLRSLTGAVLELPFYPWLHVAPNGRVFVSGPDTTTRYLNTTGAGSWTTVSNTNNSVHREYGGGVMYEPGKVLIMGGGNPPTNTAEVIDLNAGSPSWRYTNPMANARRHMNATLLPDGTVLTTGGSSSSDNNAAGAVHVAELWNPATETWTAMASAPTPRLYHSTAALLPDGRVVSGGGGFPTAQGDIDHPSAEFFSPPYLFKGSRPAITSAPASVTYGQTFSVQTPDAASIAQVTLVKLFSVTHATNMGQRFNRLSFTQASGALNVTAPASGNLCPPGHYLLFILNGNGVPSVARIVRIS